MRRIRSFLPLSLTIASALAAEVVDVTDLPIFNSLAPCAASALSYNVMSMTYDLCPTGVTDLKNCVCTKGSNLATVQKEMSSSVSWSCGGTASEDQASATKVLSAYCNQETTLSFDGPATPVQLYITDIPEFELLAPCAASAVSYAALYTMTQYNCPSEAPLLATCACAKNQNSLLISQIINTSVKYSCSGNTADITSAQAFFKAYCALNNGTSSFPQFVEPAGDMTYYITDLPQYSSLAPCASRALSYAVQGQTYYMCPEGPKQLGSCACLKEGISTDISSIIRSSVKDGCGAGTEDISSAFSVYDLYCNAVKGSVTPAGITNSVTQTYPTGGTVGSGNGGNQGPGPGGVVGTGNGPQETGGSTIGDSNQGKDKSKAPGGPSIGLIAGIVAGVVVVLIALAGIIFFVIRSKRRQANVQQAIPDHPTPPPNGMPDFFNGKQELAANEITPPAPGTVPTAPPSPSPSTLKVGAPGRMDNVSPVSAHASAFTPPPNKAELHGQPSPYHPPMPNSAELQGQTSLYSPQMPNSAELYAQGNNVYPPPNRPELQGQGQGQIYPPPNRPELQGQASPYYPQPNRPELAGYYHPQQQQQQQPQQMVSPMSQMSPQMQGYQQHAYTNSQNIPPHIAHGQQPPIELSPMSWHSGPVPGYHEMDASPRGPPGPPGAPGQAM